MNSASWRGSSHTVCPWGARVRAEQRRHWTRLVSIYFEETFGFFSHTRRFFSFFCLPRSVLVEVTLSLSNNDMPNRLDSEAFRDGSRTSFVFNHCLLALSPRHR